MEDISNYDIFVWAIIGMNVAFSFFGFSDRAVFDKFKFHVGSILHAKEYIRMFSSAFLHADYVHLGLNMFVFWSFSQVMPIFISLPEFIAIYFVSLFAGNFLSLFFHKNEFNYSAIGASGAVSGVVFASIMFFPFGSIRFVFLPFIDIPSWIFGIMYLLYTVYGMSSRRDNIGHEAHLGGAVAGLLMAFAFRFDLAMENPIISTILLAIPFLILFIKPKAKSVRSGGTRFVIENDRKPTARTKRSVDDLYYNKEWEEEKELNALLEKIQEQGTESLNINEKRRLTELSKKKQ